MVQNSQLKGHPREYCRFIPAYFFMFNKLHIGTGVFEIIAGLMIALNVLARFFAILMIIFVLAATFYFHDFWNQPAPGNATALIDALKNLSLIGALFIIAGYGKGPRSLEPAYGDV